MKIPELSLTNKEFYTIAFDWGVFSACYAIGFVSLLFGFWVFPTSFRIISTICFIVGLYALYERGKILKSKPKGAKKNANRN